MARVRRFLFLVLLIGSIGTAGYYGWASLNRAKRDNTLTATATIGELVVTVTERGELESSQSVTVLCELSREQSKLVTIVPEGSQVKKGDVVGGFDTEAILRSISEQEIKFKQAEGKEKACKKDVEISENKGEGDIDKALLALKLAELDRDSYLEGEYQVELDGQRGAIELAKKQLREAEENLEFTKTLVKKGFEQQEKVRLVELGLQEKRFLVDRDKAKLMVLEKFTKLKKETELNAKARDAKRDLERTRKSTDAANDKTRSDLEAASETTRVEKATLERFRKQLAQCEIRAPDDGIVVYVKRPWDESSRIQPGAMLYYQQPIFSLPNLSKMLVKVKVHESVVKKVIPGLSADILIDAIPNQPLRGVVENVGTLAQSEGWRGGAVKEYLTRVTVTDLPTAAGIKPGMTAEVKILVKVVPGALMVPVQAVTEKGGVYHAYVRNNISYERREVRIGDSNEQFAQIVEGLVEGDVVALDARSRSNAELKRETETINATKTPSEATAPPKDSGS